ncbi:MAG: hypothetical protein LQ343_005969 [Gyalolechia ehrenbergii]|nr:MAG: hypothetical protein LQ343_005969 [Gyalolechia ehrenbergii]
MSSLASLFKRPRSKSEKTHTPPKVVFGDLDTAYASIAQKNTPSTPNLRRAVGGNVSSGVEINTAWSPIQSPQSEVSPSAPLLSQKSPEAIRVSHLSGDLFLPKDSDSSLYKSKFSQAFDPFGSTGQHRGSFTTLDFKKHIQEGYFGTSADGEADPASRAGKSESAGSTKILSAYKYPELQQDQLEACSKLSGAEKLDMDGGQPLDRCGTIQSLSKRHIYGLVGSNDDIHSVRGSHIKADETDEDRANESSVVEQVEWSPRSSLEVYPPKEADMVVQQDIGRPPSMPLPQTPKDQEVSKYRGLQDFSSPTEQASRSSESYGNTRRLLDISAPHLPRQNPQGDSFFNDLVHFAREGQSSSSHGDSNKSFATFSIEEAHGNVITRPVSQGQFQHLENAISSHLRRESQASNAAMGGEFVRVGQISFHFPQGSEADCGPGSSQTTDSSEMESDVDFSVVQPALRTRNGTPPLLFGGSSRSKRDTDWETIGDSNELTSSIADCSDSPSTSPPKGSSLFNTRKVLKHPAHPRYTHSWDLQQDVRSGTFVLTPQYKPSAVSSFPNNNGVTSLALRNNISSYSHPTPLTKDHPHPFLAPAPKIGPSKSAGAIEVRQHTSSECTTNTTAPQSPGPYDSSAIFLPPPLPTKDPSRLLKKLVSEEQIELQNIIRPPAPLQHRSVKPNSSNSRQVLTLMDATKTPQGSLAKQQSGQNGAASIGMKTVSGSNGPSHGRIGGKRSDIDSTPPRMLDGLTVIEGHTESQRDLAPAHSAPGSCNVENVGSGTVRFLNRLDDDSSGQGRHDMSRGARTGAISVSTCTSTHDAPVSTLSAGPGPSAQPADWEISEAANSPHIHARHAIKNPWSYEQRIARSYLVACGILPILLPLYIFGWLDVVMRVHTCGQYRAFPANEKRMATGVLIAWLVLVAGAVPAITILRSGWWAADLS